MRNAAWVVVLWGPAAVALAPSPSSASNAPPAAGAPLAASAPPAANPPTAPAAAAPAVTPPVPASPEQIAAAKAEADRLIAAAHAERYFVNVTKDASPTVQHVASGMVCSFAAGQRNAIIVYQTEAAPGDDVSCGTTLVAKNGPPIVLTQYAARYPTPRTLQQELAASLASIRVREPSAKPAEGKYPNVQMGASPPPHDALRLEMTQNGQRLFTRAAASVVRGWVVSQRITTPFSNAQTADMVGEILLASAANQVAAARPDPQAEAQARLSTGDAAANEAARLLKGAPAAFFADLTAGGVVRLRHKPSGLTCRFGPVPANNHLLANATGFICATTGDFGAVFWEGGYDPQGNVDKARASITRSVTTEYPDAKALDGFADRTGGPTHLSLRFAATDKQGRKLFVRAAYGQAGDWAIFQRIESAPGLSPTGADKLIDDQGERELLDALAQASEAQTKATAETRLPPAEGRP